MKLSRNVSLAVACLLGLAAGTSQAQLTGEIKADGSSTVYLVTEAMAVHFKKLNPMVNITVGISGTGGGFKKFANGETDIQDASRKIKDTEDASCKKNGVEYVELQVGWDGLAVIIHPENNWARTMTLDQLKKIWHPDSAAMKWSDVDPSWPNEKIQLFGAGPDSGTFDYFTEGVNGKEKVSRKDYNASEDDNTTINGVADNKHALGYLGLAYAVANKGKVNMASLKGKDSKGFIEPSPTNVLNRSYPLSRPLFIYVKTASLKRPEVREFCQFYTRRADIVGEAKYVPLNLIQQQQQKKKLDQALKALK